MKISLAIIFVSVATTAHAQPKKAAPKPAQVKPAISATTYSQEPFYLDDGANLPVGYNGNDIISIYRILKKAPLRRDEFETSAQFQARKDALNLALITPKIKRNSTLAICVKAKGVYNADSGTFEITFPLTSAPSFVLGTYGNEGDEGLILYPSSYAKQEEYTATNGFGAKAQVLRQDFQDYGVFLNGWSKITLYRKSWEHQDEAPPGRFLISIAPEKAKAVRWDMMAAITFVLKPNYFSDASDRTEKATLESPTETWHNYHVARGTVQDVVIYSSKTGEVICKSSVKNADGPPYRAPQ